jgi:predicted dehydrogenase
MWGDDQGPEHFDVDDSATAFIRTTEGTISMEVAWATNREHNTETHVRGTEAGAAFDRHGDGLTLNEAASNGTPHLRDSDLEFGGDDPHGEEVEQFVGSIATGQPPGINTIEEGLVVQRVIDAIYTSSETGQAVQFDDRPAATTEADA